jgi:hypothetical protein
MALPKPDLDKVKGRRLPPTGLSHRENLAKAAGRTDLSPRLSWVLDAVGTRVLAAGWRWLVPSRDDELNQKAGALYRQLAEQDFGQVKSERAFLPGNVVRLVLALPGIDEDRELEDALERVSAIHEQVEREAPELVGRIVFAYSGNARQS